MLFRFVLYRWWVFAPARSARAKATARAAHEPAATTGVSLARTPDGGLVGD
jgi:hypothetical protein